MNLLIALVLLYGCSKVGTNPTPTPVSTLPSPTPIADPCQDLDKVLISKDELAAMRITVDEIKNLQFYNSGALQLRRKVTDKAHAITDHKLVTLNGTTYEEIDLDCLTPGIFVRSDADMLYISFEPNGDGIAFLAHGHSYLLTGYPIHSGEQEEDPEKSLLYQRARWSLYGSSELLISRADHDKVVVRRRKMQGNPISDN